MLAVGMKNFIEAHGGKVVTNTHVKRIIVENGRGTGVELEDGRIVKAKKAIGTSSPPHLFVEMVGRENLPERIIKYCERYRPDEIGMYTLHLALNEAPRWKAIDKKPELEGTVAVCFGFDNPYDIRDQYNDLRMGIPPRRVGGQTITASNVDPSQVPPGKSATLLWQYACYNLRDGGPQKWDEIKDEYADYCLEAWRKAAPNLTPENIIARYIQTPLDTERGNISMIGGSMMGGYHPDQWGRNRPFHGEVEPFRTPIEGVYLCGCIAPNGGGCSGAAGYGAANVIAEDLKIKKWWKPLTLGEPRNK